MPCREMCLTSDKRTHLPQNKAKMDYSIHMKTLFNQEIRRKRRKKPPSLVKKIIQDIFFLVKEKGLISLECKTGKAAEQMKHL